MNELTNNEINTIQKLILEKIQFINKSYEIEFLEEYKSFLNELYLKLNTMYDFLEN